jgi:hypothetical protein
VRPACRAGVAELPVLGGGGPPGADQGQQGVLGAEAAVGDVEVELAEQRRQGEAEDALGVGDVLFAEARGEYLCLLLGMRLPLR